MALLRRVVDSGFAKPILETGLGLARQNPVILFYHGVTAHREQHSVRNANGKHLLRDVFVEHLRVLKKRRKVISLKRMIDGLIEGEALTNAVAITFDDGYENNATVAAPVLADFRMPATFFLTSGFIGTDRMIWTDVLEDAFGSTARTSLDYPPLKKTFPLTTTRERLAALEEVKRDLKRRPHADCLVGAKQVCDALDVPGKAAAGLYRFMSWDQARSLVAAGFEVGGHTQNHPMLSRISLADAQREILGSCEDIRAQAGTCSDVFCYPNGRAEDYSEDLKEFCSRHFRAALSAERGFADRGNLFALRRVGALPGARAANLAWSLMRV